MKQKQAKVETDVLINILRWEPLTPSQISVGIKTPKLSLHSLLGHDEHHEDEELLTAFNSLVEEGLIEPDYKEIQSLGIDIQDLDPLDIPYRVAGKTFRERLQPLYERLVSVYHRVLRKSSDPALNTRNIY